MSKKQQYLLGVKSGVKTGIPICIGVIPVGIAFAILSRQCGFNSWQTILMSIIVFAGASQIMAVGMFAQSWQIWLYIWE